MFIVADLVSLIKTQLLQITYKVSSGRVLGCMLFLGCLNWALIAMATYSYHRLIMGKTQKNSETMRPTASSPLHKSSIRPLLTMA